MAKFQVQSCSCLDFPCCGCGTETVYTGQDAIDAAREDEDLMYAEEDWCEPDDPDGPEDNFRDDVEADADVLRSAGMGVDEDYGLGSGN